MKNKIFTSISAFALAVVISFSGVGGSYIQSKASSGAFDSLWNTDVDAWTNIKEHIFLWSSAVGVFINPIYFTCTAVDFYNFMISDGYSEEVAEDCVHGGGGHIRDGISVDDEGNVTYSDDVSDLFHGFIQDFLDSNRGYILFKTTKASDVDSGVFNSLEARENFIQTVNNFGILYCILNNNSSGYKACYIPTENIYHQYAKTMYMKFNDSTSSSQGYYVYVGDMGTKTMYFEVLEDDWSFHNPFYLVTELGNENSNFLDFDTRSYSLSDLHISDTSYKPYLFYFLKNFNNGLNNNATIYSNDGRNIKIWYNLDAFKNYDVGNQPFYVRDSFNNYNTSNDNSLTLTQQQYEYFQDNSSTMYQTINNNIVNNYGSDIDEKTLQDILDNYFKDLDNDNDNGGSNNNNNSGGTGVLDIIDGIGKVFDVLLSLIGKIMGIVADFTNSVLDLFSGFTTFTDGFSQFLTGAFSFIPPEIWNLISVGLSLMVLLAVLKFLRK